MTRTVIGINNAQYIHKTGTHWGEGHIRKRTPVIHHHVCDVQALKTTRTTVLLECQPVLECCAIQCTVYSCHLFYIVFQPCIPFRF